MFSPVNLFECKEFVFFFIRIFFRWILKNFKEHLHNNELFFGAEVIITVQTDTWNAFWKRRRKKMICYSMNAFCGRCNQNTFFKTKVNKREFLKWQHMKVNRYRKINDLSEFLKAKKSNNFFSIINGSIQVIFKRI